MEFLPGVYMAKKKNGELYYRSSLTYLGKHISLGSFPNENKAHQAYLSAKSALSDFSLKINSYSLRPTYLPFDKWVMLINFRDNEIYFKTPIYLKKNYFLYYLDEQNEPLKFAADDLFYYSNHSIMRRGGHLFVADFGMQVNILSRYGIKNFAVAGRDYRFVNGDTTDFRYENIEIINKYHGVQREEKNGRTLYAARIHLRGNLLIGRYPTEVEAAAAYNKAANILKANGLDKNFPKNYLIELTEKEYRTLYDSIQLSQKIQNYGPGLH